MTTAMESLRMSWRLFQSESRGETVVGVLLVGILLAPLIREYHEAGGE